LSDKSFWHKIRRCTASAVALRHRKSPSDAAKETLADWLG
jgi:hypothetical protein